MLSATIATIHYLGLALSFSSVFIRGVSLKHLEKEPQNRFWLNWTFKADNFWGLSAIVMLGTGLYRAFGGLEKGSPYYLQNHYFWAKMTLFILVAVIEIYPMVSLIRWRIQSRKNSLQLQTEKIRKIKILCYIQILLLVLIVVVASRMARGI